MYLSCLLVEDGIRHLFHINLTVSCLFSSYSLACISAPSSTRHLRLWNRRPHRASSLISYLSYQSVLDGTPISQPLPLLQRHCSSSLFPVQPPRAMEGSEAKGENLYQSKKPHTHHLSFSTLPLCHLSARENRTCSVRKQRMLEMRSTL